jgi:hypothetical protein
MDYSIACDIDLYSSFTGAINSNPHLNIIFSCRDFSFYDGRVNFFPEIPRDKLVKAIAESPPLSAQIFIPASNLDHHDFDRILQHYARTPARLVFQDANNMGVEIIAQWYKSMRDNSSLSISIDSNQIDLDKNPSLPIIASEIQRMAKENNVRFREGRSL